VEVTILKKKPLIKIGLGNHPRRPVDQLKEKLDPPRFPMQTAAGEGQLSKDSLMNLFDRPSQTSCNTTAASMTTTTATTYTTTPTTTTTATSSPLKVPSSPVKLIQRFNITSPDKPKLAMELVSEMDTPQKAPLMRELVKGSTISIETLNNSQKSLYTFRNAQINHLQCHKILSINLFKKLLSKPCELEPKRSQAV
jgi:hypothetical protein